MSRKTVLLICHNHPTIRIGGAEIYTLELHKAMRESNEFRPILLVNGVLPESREQLEERTLIAPIDNSNDEYFMFLPHKEYNGFYGTYRDKDLCGRVFRGLLEAFKPDIIHFQHTQLLGYDLIREARNTLPQSPIVYTLHEYLPICYRVGQMVQTKNNALCQDSSPRRCNECFPQISPQSFFVRKRYIQAHFELVDLFLAPSKFLLERYVDWGIERERIRFEEYGRIPDTNQIKAPERENRNRLGFFGQITQFKGIDVLLEAMIILQKEYKEHRKNQNYEHYNNSNPRISNENNAHLWIHGANLESQQDKFKEKINRLLKATTKNVSMIGSYKHNEVSRLMRQIDWVVVPSIWWENSPLVIQEAYQNKRPIICSGIGGMAEKVADGVNGIHFQVGNSRDLADVIQRAISSTEMWKKMSENCPELYKMQEHIGVLSEIYNSLLQRRVLDH